MFELTLMISSAACGTFVLQAEGCPRWGLAVQPGAANTVKPVLQQPTNQLAARLAVYTAEMLSGMNACPVQAAACC
jgi:hypothetical protein